eukprot:1189957-Prorocentrum_minimum.AAC.2
MTFTVAIFNSLVLNSSQPPKISVTAIAETGIPGQRDHRDHEKLAEIPGVSSISRARLSVDSNLELPITSESTPPDGSGAIDFQRCAHMSMMQEPTQKVRGTVRALPRLYQ